MKKLTGIFIVLLTISFAQITTANFQLGLIGGLNIVTPDIEIENKGADISSSTDFGIGGIFDWNLNKTFSLRLEPMYLQKGLGKTEVEVQPGVDFYGTSSFLELPVLIKAEFGSDIRPYFIVGPSFGMLLSSEISAEFNNITFKGDSKSASENFDVSVVFGGGINYPMDKFSIFLEGRYSYGFTNNIKGGLVVLSGGNVTSPMEWNKKTDKLKYRGFQIMAGMTFPLGKNI